MSGLLLGSTIDFSGFSPQQLRAAVAILIAVGTLYCFLGYRALKFVLALTGLLVGGALIGGIVIWVTNGGLLPFAIGAIIGGVLGAVAVSFFYRAGVFVLGLLGGAVVARVIQGGASDITASSITFGSAVFGGLSGLFLERPLVTLATSAIGALIVVNGIAFFVLGGSTADSFQTAVSDPNTQTILLVCWLVLTVIGIFTQFVTHKRKEKD